MTAHQVARGDIAAEVMGTGTLEAHFKASISPEIQGRLVDVLVDQNDKIASGQLLARLDDSELRQQVEVAQATLAAARATAERVRADEARAAAILKQAQLEDERVAALVSGKAASLSDRDKSIEKLRVAEADLTQTQAAIVEADRRQITDEKQLAYQQELLANASILSPFDGLVVRRNRDPGDVVVPGSSILDVIATQEIWVSAWVDETAMAQLVVNQPARVVFRSEPAKPYPGIVARLGRQTDRETREFLVDVLARELPRNWTIGQRAEVYIETARKTDALVLPSKYVVWRNGKSGALVNEGGRAVWRAVVLGLRGGEEVEVASGLEAGEEVVAPLAADERSPMDGRRIHIQ
ncbi:MAG: efflux RND transporter periplasmic adaptor subunit [Planctomycetota bacterium]